MTTVESDTDSFCFNVANQELPQNANNSCGFATVEGETFAHSDGSWPCLRSILSTNSEDKVLHHITPNGYFPENASTNTYRMALQRIDRDDRDASTQTMGYPTFTLFNGTTKPVNVYTRVAEAAVRYTAMYPDPTPHAELCVGADCFRVDSCADSTFSPPSQTEWNQFYFSATVPGNFYGQNITLQREVVTDDGESAQTNCTVKSTMECHNLDEDHKPGDVPLLNGGCLNEAMVNTPDSTPFGASSCLCGSGSCSSGGTESSNCALSGNNAATLEGQTSPVSTQYVSANYRDGYTRLQASNVLTDPNTGQELLPSYLDGSPTVCHNDATGGDAGQIYTGYLKPDSDRSTEDSSTTGPYNVPDQVTFAGCSTCVGAPSSMSDVNALVMMDMNSLQPVEPRKVFVTLTWNPSDDTPTPNFAEMVGASQIVSFNVLGRMPTCLSVDDVNPKNSTSYFESGSSESFKNIGCFDTDLSYNPWKWTKNQDLGFNTGAYLGMIFPAWDSASHSEWPALSPSDTSSPYPDVVLRIVFVNPYVIDQATGTPTPLVVADGQFEDKVVTLLGQNKPGTPLSLTSAASDSVLTPAMRQVAFVEYTAAVLYRALYNVFLDTTTASNRWFQVQNHLVQTGKYEPYGASEFLRDYFTEHLASYQVVQSTSSLSVSAELSTLSNFLVANTDTYFRYPRFVFDEATQTLNVEFYCDLFTHLTLQNQNAKIETYLQAMFQDADVAIIVDGESSFAPTGLSPAPSLQLKGSQTHDPSKNLVFTTDSTLSGDGGGDADKDNTELTFTTSYCWVQPVQFLSPVAALYIAIQGSQSPLPDWLSSWYGAGVWSTVFAPVWQPGVPRLVLPYDDDGDGGQFGTCLTEPQITTVCADKLCPSSGNCLCDYSIFVGSEVRNPASDLYFNNSNGICACLANESAPVGSNVNVRALNLTTLCFSSACQKYKYRDAYPDTNCSSEGCASFRHAVSTQNRALRGTEWTDAFGNSGNDFDVDTINSDCHLSLESESGKPLQVWTVNWFVVAAAVCLMITIPVGVGVDFALTKTLRSRTVYWILGVVSVFMVGFAALLVYLMSGVYTCPGGYDASNKQEAVCADRVFRAIPLSKDMCTEPQPVFCQCNNVGQACTGGAFDDNAVGAAECSGNNMCCVCTNACAGEISSVDRTLKDIQNVPSSGVILCAVAVWVFLSVVAFAVIPTLLGRPRKLWTGKSFKDLPPYSLLLRYGSAAVVAAAIGAGLGVGAYYSTPYFTITTNTINTTKQAQDMASDQACPTS